MVLRDFAFHAFLPLKDPDGVKFGTEKLRVAVLVHVKETCPNPNGVSQLLNGFANEFAALNRHLPTLTVFYGDNDERLPFSVRFNPALFNRLWQTQTPDSNDFRWRSQ
jgi:PhoPQ-activated pathogenicity-related protein